MHVVPINQGVNDMNNNMEAVCESAGERQILAIAYVPMQNADFSAVFPISEGLVIGTIFPELYLPFSGEGRTK